MSKSEKYQDYGTEMDLGTSSKDQNDKDEGKMSTDATDNATGYGTGLGTTSSITGAGTNATGVGTFSNSYGISKQGDNYEPTENKNS
jgi:hypothetical protein